MPEAPVCILGGLPVIAEVSFSYDSYSMEHDASVEDLFWMKRDGTKGKSIPQHLFDKALEYGNDYQGCNIIEQVNDHLVYEADNGRHNSGDSQEGLWEHLIGQDAGVSDQARED